MVRKLTDRIVKLSVGKHRLENLKQICEVLIKNKYPTHFYDPIIKQRIHVINNDTGVLPNEREKTAKYISLSHVPEIYNKI